MTIAQVSQRYGLSADTLRYYERIGLIPAVNRSSGGARDYTDENCRWVEFAKCMRGAGLPIDALIEYVALCQLGESTYTARKNILVAQRDLLSGRIDEMQATLTRLNGKIDNYDRVLLLIEQGLTAREEEKNDL